MVGRVQSGDRKTDYAAGTAHQSAETIPNVSFPPLELVADSIATVFKSRNAVGGKKITRNQTANCFEVRHEDAIRADQIQSSLPESVGKRANKK